MNRAALMRYFAHEETGAALLQDLYLLAGDSRAPHHGALLLLHAAGMKKPKRPRDPNQLAKLIVDMTTGEVPNDSPKEPESAATKAKRAGGRKGGKARAKKLPAKKRTAIARTAARVRWGS